jgi:hypothetical protein
MKPSETPISEVSYMGLYSNGEIGFKDILLIGLAIMGCSPAFAADTAPVGTTQTEVLAAHDGSQNRLKFSGDTGIEFSLSAGPRKDELKWSIAGTAAGTDPNVLSELEWTSVNSFQITLANRSRFLRHFYCRTALNYAWIQNGTLRDSDYDEDNHTSEWSRSLSESNGDEMWDVSTAGGYAFILLHDRLLVAPLLGYSYHKQNLRITNGTQVVSARPPAPDIGPLTSELNSTYFARWMGPWIGCDLRYLTENRGPNSLTMEFGLSLELHYADYYGEGNWNLRSSWNHPKNFEHEAEGYGIGISGEWLLTLTSHWDLNLTANYQYWDTGTGTDRKFLADGGTAATLLNDVTWTSSSFMIGASYHF